MTRDRTKMYQRIIWHIRWILLLMLILFNGLSLLFYLKLQVVITIDSMSFCLYFLLSQLDGYLDCKSNCSI